MNSSGDRGVECEALMFGDGALVRMALSNVSPWYYNVTYCDPTRSVFAHVEHIEEGILVLAFLHLMPNATARKCTAERITKLICQKHLI